MKQKYKNSILFGAALFSFVAVLGLGGGTALAATKTWDGGGADNNFSTAENWSDDAIPENGDVLVFPADVDADTEYDEDRRLVNDIENLSVAGIQFTEAYIEGDYEYYQISGNEISISGDILVDSGSPNISTGLVLIDDIKITGGASSLILDGSGASGIAINLGSHDLDVSVSSLYVYANISGSGNISAYRLFISNNATDFTGSVDISGEGASLNLYPCSTLNSAAGITMGAETQLYLQCDRKMSVNVPITLNGAGYEYVGQDNDTHTASAFFVSSYGDTKKVADISIKDLTITTNSTYDSLLNGNDKVTIEKFTSNGKKFSRLPGSQGILLVDGKAMKSSYLDVVYDEDYEDEGEGDYARIIGDMRRYIIKSNYLSPFTVSQGGILAGTGKVTNVTVENGGTVAPGLSPGTLTVANIEWEEGGVYEFEIGKDAADQIKANGKVTLGNGTLEVVLLDGAKPEANKEYVIIDNDGDDKVDGTFADLPEGATFEADGYVFQISYKGGDGNDVTLTVKSEPGAPNTGFNLLKNNPAVTLAVTTASAGALLVIAKRYGLIAAKK